MKNDDLPMSMRFYDPIISILQNNMDPESIYSFSLERNLNIDHIIENSLVNKIITKLEHREDKPFIKLQQEHKKNLPKFIDHTNQHATLDMQSGKCIVVEHSK
jgi:hypothetical protein